jgi:hypothetical protein
MNLLSAFSSFPLSVPHLYTFDHLLCLNEEVDQTLDQYRINNQPSYAIKRLFTSFTFLHGKRHREDPNQEYNDFVEDL